MAPQSISIVAAALITQLALFLILALGLAIDGTTWVEDPWRGARFPAKPWPSLVILCVAGLGPLILSKDVADLGRNVFGSRDLAMFSPDRAIAIALFADAFVLMFLVHRTGGSRSSPFTSALFALPALAIFLWQPYHLVLVYVAVVIVGSLVALVPSADYRRDNGPTSAISFIFIAGLVLCLTAFISYVTRKP